MKLDKVSAEMSEGRVCGDTESNQSRNNQNSLLQVNEHKNQISRAMISFKLCFPRSIV